LLKKFSNQGAEGVSEEGAKKNIQTEDETGGYRKLHSEEFHKLYSLLNTIHVTKSRTMR
jgi:hypothetical protein